MLWTLSGIAERLRDQKWPLPYGVLSRPYMELTASRCHAWVNSPVLPEDSGQLVWPASKLLYLQYLLETKKLSKWSQELFYFWIWLLHTVTWLGISQLLWMLICHPLGGLPAPFFVLFTESTKIASGSSSCPAGGRGSRAWYLRHLLTHIGQSFLFFFSGCLKSAFILGHWLVSGLWVTLIAEGTFVILCDVE